jgi:hypothetical protein
MARLRHALFVVVLAVAVFYAPARPAHACSCGAATYDEHVAFADAVFDGTATKRYEAPTEPGQPVSSARPVTFTFAVARNVKQAVPDPVEVVTAADGASCGTSFDLGVEYRVFVKRRDNGEWSTGLCSGNQKTSELPAPSTTTTRAKPTTTTAKPVGATTTSTVEATTTSAPTTTTTSDDNAVTINNRSDDGGSGWVVPVAIGALALAAGLGFGLYQRSRRTDPAL